MNTKDEALACLLKVEQTAQNANEHLPKNVIISMAAVLLVEKLNLHHEHALKIMLRVWCERDAINHPGVFIDTHTSTPHCLVLVVKGMVKVLPVASLVNVPHFTLH